MSPTYIIKYFFENVKYFGNSLKNNYEIRS